MSGKLRNVIVCSVRFSGPNTENWYGGGKDIVTAPVTCWLSEPELIEPASVSRPAFRAVGGRSGELASTVPTVQVEPLKHGASTLLILTPFGFPNAIAPVAASSAPLWVIVTTTSRVRP